jgi:hypothetical protein
LPSSEFNRNSLRKQLTRERFLTVIFKFEMCFQLFPLDGVVTTKEIKKIFILGQNDPHTNHSQENNFEIIKSDLKCELIESRSKQQQQEEAAYAS